MINSVLINNSRTLFNKFIWFIQITPGPTKILCNFQVSRKFASGYLYHFSNQCWLFWGSAQNIPSFGLGCTSSLKEFPLKGEICWMLLKSYKICVMQVNEILCYSYHDVIHMMMLFIQWCEKCTEVNSCTTKYWLYRNGKFIKVFLV